MKTLTFPEIADLLTEVSLARFSREPEIDVQGVLAVFDGTYFLSNGDEIPAQVVYIYSAASEKNIRAELRKLKISAHAEVVYPPTSEVAANAIDWLALGAKKVLSSRDYLIAFMRGELGKYRSELRHLQHQDFEKPSVQTPSGLRHRIPNPLELFLGEGQSSDDEGQIAVLLAEAGHGKTYLTEWVAGRLADSDPKVLPIFVSARQWTGMANGAEATLEATICNSFRAFGCPVRWVEGREHAFLRVALKLGIFRLIFDGFDEFALQTRRGTSVRDALNSLVGLASDTGARVLVTARTSFWDSQVAVEAADVAKDLDIYVLQPFDVPKAENYFRRKLSADPEAVASARTAFQQLHASNPGLAGRGVVLRLVADLAQKKGALAGPVQSEPISWLMYSLCLRDQERQKLPMGPDMQLSAMREFVLMKLTGVLPTDETFGLALQVAAEIDDAALPDVLTRFRSHALIRRAPDGQWTFLNSQVELTLFGQLVVDTAINDLRRGESDLARMNANAKLRPDEEIDLAYIVLALLDHEGEPNGLMERCQKVFSMLTRVAPIPVGNPFSYSLFRRLATNVALKLKDVSGIKDRADRTKALVQAIGKDTVEGLHVSRAFTGYDLTGVTFRHCLFQDVTFAACKLDESTVFSECRFEGGEANRCEGFGRAKFLGCSNTTSGQEFIRSEQVRDGAKRYGKDDLHRDLRALTEKFVRQAGTSFKTVHKDELHRGRIAASPNAKDVIGAFEKYLLAITRHSGDATGGYEIRDSAREAVRFFYQNNSLVGPMADAAEAVAAKLALT